MDNQIKYYLHIQQIKRLYNEINLIKKHKKKCKIQNLMDQMQRGILNREDLILKIIGLYDLMEYWCCKGNIEKLKKIIKCKEKEINDFFSQNELDKYQMMIDQPHNN